MKNFLTLSCASLLFVGCASTTPSANNAASPEDDTIVITTSFYPYTHFAEQVGGDLVTVTQITAPGSDPHSFKPAPQQIAAVYESDLFMFNGEGQEAWAERIHEEVEDEGVAVLIGTEIVDRMPYDGGHDDSSYAEASADRHHEEDEHDEHDDHGENDHEDDHDDHGHDGHHDEHDEDEHHDDHEGHDDHNHGEWDPHVWLDPLRVEGIIQAIADELSAIAPSLAEEFQTNADAYIAELRTLDKDITIGLASCALDSVIVSHDAFRYLANRYDFHTLEIAGLAPSAIPNAKRLAELAEIAEEKGIKHVFFETQVSSALSDTLAAEIGAETLVLHSLEALTKDERAAGMTYILVQRQNLENLQLALKCS